VSYYDIADNIGHSFSCCCLTNQWNSVKFSENSKL